MIYTCTLNPSIDYQIHSDSIHLGQLNRMEDMDFYPGGKGINVSRVLKNLQVDSVALGFVGGFTGAFLKKELKKLGIKVDFTDHELPTRINIKIKTMQDETEINGPGAAILPAEKKDLLSKISMLDEGDYLVLSGSRPAKLPFDYYETIVQIASKQKAKIILDIPEQEICQLLPYKPILIKPNKQELEILTKRNIDDMEDVVLAAKDLIAMGAENVIVSLGENGAVFVNQEKIMLASPPGGTLVSSVGAGDSLVAGFIAKHIQTKSIKEIFQYSVAAGTATAYSKSLCNKKTVDSIEDKVIISDWKEE